MRAPKLPASQKEIVLNGARTRSYQLSQSVLERIWLERLRQKQLFREGKLSFACDSTLVCDDRKHRALSEEVGEVAKAIDVLERARGAGIKFAREDLQEELTQVAAVAIAWLESMEDGQ
jgi:hypothetical protein